MLPFILLIQRILDIYLFLVFVYIIMHWLIHFSIINQYQPLVQKIFKTLKQLIEPVLSRIRSILPSMNGLDLSPIVLFLLIYFIKDVIWQMSVA